ncbi:TPA: hypothetical protein DCZ46_02585 [Candidatus Campbellbacteria bacterium]|uniref:HDOD domain-containing protein n=1 Tax=Candidatus Nomurabacteria bacterium GW2011_GWC2_42_20 TaxID=1618756 RepID=A0A0G1BQ89_9BACT|nr:MAG: hypothetical protein UU88_C0003G0072 [Parcubacteria group bacterium GW2011_GWC1_42_11]KKS48406.1 MAG: hypothetical protein UV12_C0001G0101 [Candidatus Nomurabacteria bacterium GW2011_GWC2_42_20]KKS59436.1 MAG: hypothetical protein UV24_C0001G0024 [Candidatus Nomurabacteria bacterium GW2011_GWA2_42_41]KKT09982.1 MAG: hypothetical protein UV86_C0001G0084 [Candidatus Nomurabacteria bacterium GW2011_GWB1_43_20]TAN36041.1 MAG: HDOD domain-containing protein [Patescibacteria group bacterium]
MEEEKVYVTQGFIEKFATLFADDNSSFGDIAKLLVFQPRLVVRLLHVANHMCTCHGSFKRPTTVQGIINILGFGRVEDEINLIEYAPLHEERKVLNQAISCYVLASVYASIAEQVFGKKKAPEHFLAGLIAPLVEEDNSILYECNDELKGYFNPNYAHGMQIEGLSTIAHVKELTKGFEKGINSFDTGHLYTTWDEARRNARATLIVYSGGYAE